MTNKDFKYIWQGDTTYLILYKDIKISYIPNIQDNVWRILDKENNNENI